MGEANRDISGLMAVPRPVVGPTDGQWRPNATADGREGLPKNIKLCQGALIKSIKGASGYQGSIKVAQGLVLKVLF
ncbi:hypothetical protein M2366_001230 [Aeromonas sp. BIGb0405]|nr:hypothetical protein [Aeromonas sp. BIGb0405]